MIKEEELAQWLQKWYTSQCDGDWEHQYGVIIETIDKPGWRIKIDLTNANYEEKKFHDVYKEENEYDWYHCSLHEETFESTCSLNNLNRVLLIFFNWIADSVGKQAVFSSFKEHSVILLQKWYIQHCNGVWEKTNKIKLTTLDNPGWSISINLSGTQLENKELNEVFIDRSDTNWIYCKVLNKTFEGRCGSLNLEELLTMFINWSQ